MMLDNNNH